MAKLLPRLWAILKQRCPACLQGRVFRTLIVMHETCPLCGVRYEREQGYFLGAMYASYFMAVPAVGLLAWGINVWIVPTWTLEWATLLAAPPFLATVPLIFRYSRVLWMHIDPPAPPEPGWEAAPPGHRIGQTPHTSAGGTHEPQ